MELDRLKPRGELGDEPLCCPVPLAWESPPQPPEAGGAKRLGEARDPVGCEDACNANSGKVDL